MSPDLTSTAPAVISAFGQTGGILGLIILSLLAIVSLVAWMGWKFMSDLINNHEKRMDAQEARHQVDRHAANKQWQEVTREISAEMKTAMNAIVRQQTSTVTALSRVDRGVEILKRRKAA